jgi:hypothetical protein
MWNKLFLPTFISPPLFSSFMAIRVDQIIVMRAPMPFLEEKKDTGREP